MRILIVSTSEQTGGAAIAAKRLMEALNNSGVKAKMIVRDKESQHISVCRIPGTWRPYFNFIWERLSIFIRLRFSRKHLFDIDIANAGTDITRLPEFAEADIIHLHWINQGMLSLKGIRKILDSGKPVVWTMHDIWPATAICHLSLECNRYTSHCCQCPYLPGNSTTDLANSVWLRKERLFSGHNITFVACSQWLKGEASKSPLLSGKQIEAIPNPIDTRLFCPGSKTEARQKLGLPTDKKLIFFASQRADNVYKGMNCLIEACRTLVKEHLEMKYSAALIIAGGHAEEISSLLPLPTYPLGYISDTRRMADVYRAADAFVLPSLSENLPNTIMEAMACGTPCIAFRVGGIPEEIDHQINGYIAEYKNSADLAHGIHWILTQANSEALNQAAVKKATQQYSQQVVAMRYIDIYNRLIGKNYLEA